MCSCVAVEKEERETSEVWGMMGRRGKGSCVWVFWVWQLWLGKSQLIRSRCMQRGAIAEGAKGGMWNVLVKSIAFFCLPFFPLSFMCPKSKRCKYQCCPVLTFQENLRFHFQAFFIKKPYLYTNKDQGAFTLDVKSVLSKILGGILGGMQC